MVLILAYYRPSDCFILSTLIFFRANLAFQNTSGTIVDIRRFWCSLCVGNETSSLLFQLFLVKASRVLWCQVLLKCMSYMSKVSVFLPKHFAYNIRQLFRGLGRQISNSLQPFCIFMLSTSIMLVFIVLCLFCSINFWSLVFFLAFFLCLKYFFLLIEISL